MNLNTITNGAIRIQLHLISLVTIFFLWIYNRQVCPFIDGLSFWEFAANISLVFLFQLLLREVLFRRWPTPRANISLSRHGYRLSVIIWCLAGLCAITVHGLRYPAFPLGSHLKLLSSYWVLGAGIIAQWEYVLLEKAERRHSASFRGAQQFLERITRRITEGYVLFTLAPVVIMLLVAIRYIFEGFIPREVAIELSYIGIFLVCTALLVATMFGRSLKKDTEHIKASLQQIERGAFTTTLDISRRDELGEMSASINQMAAGLQQRERIREAFGRFVSPRIAEEFIDKFVTNDNELTLGGQRREVVILMCDIRNFTPLAETISPEQLTALLNGYFSEMVAVIQRHGGMVDKFIGDAIMATFGLVDSEDMAPRAVRAAIEMQERLAAYNHRIAEAGMEPLQSGIGIHMGDVVAGYIGSAERMEFSVIGTAVNIAARIEAQAKAPQPSILFSKKIADEITPTIAAKHIITTPLKGISAELELFALAATTQ